MPRDSHALKAYSAVALPPGLRTLVYYRDLILVLLAKDFKVRYKGTFMGYAWSVLQPLVMSLIFASIFSLVMRVQVEAYAYYLIAGLFPWQWIANTTGASNHYFLGNRTLIKKVQFDRSALVLSAVLNEAVHFLCSMPVILGFMIYYGKSPEIEWLWMLPLLLVVHSAMMFGLGLTIATCNLFFRDLERLVGLLTQLLFYLTPIIYTLDSLPSEYRWLTFANPFAGIVLCWQGLLYSGAVSPVYLGVALTWTAGLLALGALVYRKNVGRFAESV
jgi:lipopolysaccharide transport system permease protein